MTVAHEAFFSRLTAAQVRSGVQDDTLCVISMRRHWRCVAE
jgi:hypothetical protein